MDTQCNVVMSAHIAPKAHHWRRHTTHDTRAFRHAHIPYCDATTLCLCVCVCLSLQNDTSTRRGGRLFTIQGCAGLLNSFLLPFELDSGFLGHCFIQHVGLWCWWTHAWLGHGCSFLVVLIRRTFWFHFHGTTSTRSCSTSASWWCRRRTICHDGFQIISNRRSGHDKSQIGGSKRGRL